VAVRSLERCVLVTVAAAACAFPVSARAASPDCPPFLVPVGISRIPVAGFRITSSAAVAMARASETGRRYPNTKPLVSRFCHFWQVALLARGTAKALITIDGRTGRIVASWTGYQAIWPQSRGSPELFVGAHMPLVLGALAIISLAAFVDPRRLRARSHLDLLALLAIGLSWVPFGFGKLGLSTPLVFAALALLAARMLTLITARAPRGDPPAFRWSPATLALLTLALLAGRALYNAVVASASDVGYYSVVGAQAILDGFPVYTPHGVAYGPAMHIAYLPFAALFPLPGGLIRGGDQAAHAAAITFDVLTALVLYVIGTQLRRGRAGRRLGAVLAFAWAANPIGFYPMAASSNDGFVGLLIACAVLAFASPVARGAVAGLAGAAKWVPFVLLPLFASGRESLRRDRLMLYVLAAVAAIAAVTLPVLPPGGVREIYDVSIGHLANINSPFSVWGLWHLPNALRQLGLVAVVLLAVATAVVPRERSAATAAALATAILTAVEMTLPHWIYSYAGWYVPVALIAIFARAGAAEAVEKPGPPLRGERVLSPH
jgi:hypothetical protein